MGNEQALREVFRLETISSSASFAKQPQLRRPAMTTTKAILAVAALALSAAATPALAHDDDYDYSRHARDHTQHYRFHSEVNDAHQRAHEECFYSRAELREYHRALRDLHSFPTHAT